MNNIREKAQEFESNLNSIEKWVMIGLLSALTVITFLQVFTRYALRSPLFWTEELARFLFIWVCMIGVAMGIAAKGHYGFETVFKALPKQIRIILAFIIYLSIGFFVIVLTIKGFEELPSTTRQFSSSLPVTMVWSYAAMPAGGVLMLVHLILKFIIEGPSKWH